MLAPHTPCALASTADCIAIIVFVPILENIVYPLIAKIKKSPVTLSQKLIAGLAVAGISMLVAVGLEYIRRGAPILEPKGTVATPDCCTADPAAKGVCLCVSA